MNQKIIELKNIEKYFNLQKNSFITSRNKLNSIKSLDNISLTINKGQMIGIIGRNGSGKSTLLRIMAGILQPDHGTIKVDGTISPLLQIGTGSNDENTVKENILLYGLLLGLGKKQIKKKLNNVLKFSELEKFADTKMKYLSSGMKVRIMFSTAMMVNPDILLVDEIIAVGDAPFRKKSFSVFMSFKEKQKTVVLVSHNLSIIEKYCDQVYMLENGKIITSGEPNKVVSFYRKHCNLS